VIKILKYRNFLMLTIIIVFMILFIYWKSFYWKCKLRSVLNQNSNCKLKNQNEHCWKLNWKQNVWMSELNLFDLNRTKTKIKNLMISVLGVTTCHFNITWCNIIMSIIDRIYYYIIMRIVFIKIRDYKQT